jgi:hypothetical protein
MAIFSDSNGRNKIVFKPIHLDAIAIVQSKKGSVPYVFASLIHKLTLYVFALS